MQSASWPCTSITYPSGELTCGVGFDGEMTEHNIEIGVVDESGVFRVLSPEDKRDLLDTIM